MGLQGDQIFFVLVWIARWFLADFVWFPFGSARISSERVEEVGNPGEGGMSFMLWRWSGCLAPLH